MNKPLPTDDFLVGPFQVFKVVVEGRAIPRLTGSKWSEYETELIVDGRFSAVFTDASAKQAAWLIAQAMAIGEGYSHLGAMNKDQPFAPLCGRLGSVPE